MSSYFPPREAAEDLGLALSTWYKLVAEDDSYPRPFKVGGSVRIDRAAHDAWKREQQDAANWTAYVKVLGKGGGAISTSSNGLGAAARRLGLTEAESELHRLVLTEHVRLSKLAVDMEGANAEMEKSHRLPAETGMGLALARSERQGQAVVRYSKARHAALERDALMGHFPRLFDRGPDPMHRNSAAYPHLPAAVKEKAKEVEAAKTRVAEGSDNE